ncbi:mucin-5AC-like [Anopheles funestus]|uniref:mucin-5AC-like n=1 Tax=Anopheles funestus TaxID=62324 RepID=UPI0020C654F2|nr:mucin-5AC-like [Anopheles funestus]
MLLQVLVPCLALLRLTAAGYVTVPLHSPASVTYVNPQQHAGLLAGPVRYTSGTQAALVPATVVEGRSGAVSVTSAPAPTYYTYNLQPQPVFGKASYTPAVQYHTTYGSPSVRVFEPKTFVYGVQGGSNVPTTHTVQSVPVSVSTTEYHHTSAPIPVPVTPVPHHHDHSVAVPVPTPVPVHVPVHVPVPVPVTPTYTKTVTTGPSYIPPQEKQIPVVRSRKFKVRRPAIQNQFYDIEERVIIRPVGSALVELEQPVSQTETQSKTTKTTTTFVEKRPVYSPPAPAPEVHITDEGYGTRTIARPQVVTQTTTVYTERPPLKGGYDRIEEASQSRKSAASTSKASDAEYIDTEHANTPSERPFYTQGHAIYHPQTAFVNPYATHLAPHPLVYYPSNAGHLLHHVAHGDQHSPALVATHPSTAHPGTVFHIPSSTPLYPVTPAAGSSTPLYPVTPATGGDCDGGKTPEYLPPSVHTPSPTTPAQPPVATTTPKPPITVTPGSYPADDIADDEYDDSIVIDARSGVNNYSDYTPTESDYGDVTVTAATTTSSTPLVYHHDKYRGAEQTETRLGGTSSIEVSYASRATPASDIVAFDPSTTSGGFDFGTTFRGSFPTTTIAPNPTTIRQTIGSSSSTASNTPQRSSVTIIASTTPRTVAARFSETDASSSLTTSEHREYTSHSAATSGITSQSVVVGQGLTQEQIHANQEQFIKLLSERDSIAEVGFGPKTDTSGTLIDAYVRSRVLSATPAPRDAKETSRTVNIRRIVVSRPVETEQEVEVREQSYATTIGPPLYDHEHKRDVSDVAGPEGVDRQPQQPPMYVNAKPPAFANDRDQ